MAFPGSVESGVEGAARVLQPRFKKGPWTPAEDSMLLTYIRIYGEGNWNAVRKHVGLARSGKSCRLRWTNHLHPNLKKGSFTPQEEQTIIRLQARLGNKWSLMSQVLKGRTDNTIKNFWNTRKKRLLRAGKPLYPSGISNTTQMNSVMQEDIENVVNDSFECPPLQLELPDSNFDQNRTAFDESLDPSVPLQQLPYLELCINSSSCPLDPDISAGIPMSSFFKSMSLMEPPSYQIEVPNGTPGSTFSNCIWQHHLPCNEQTLKPSSYASNLGVPLRTAFPSNSFVAEEEHMQMAISESPLEAFLLQQVQGGGRDQFFSNGLEAQGQVVPSTNKYSHTPSDPLSLLGGQALLLLNEVINPSSHMDSIVPSTNTGLPSDCEVSHFEGF